MYGGSDQDAFSISSGKLENRSVYKIPHFFVHQTVLAFSGNDMNFVGTDHIMEGIGMDTCRIDDQSGVKIALTGRNSIAVFFLLQCCYFCIKVKFHAICSCIFSQGNGKVEGTDNTAGRRIKCCHGII